MWSPNYLGRLAWRCLQVKVVELVRGVVVVRTNVRRAESWCFCHRLLRILRAEATPGSGRIPRVRQAGTDILKSLL